MAGPAFVQGTWSQAGAALLAGGTLAYAVLTGLYTVRAFRARLEDRWSSALATLVMTLLAALLYAEGARLIPAPFSTVLVGVYGGAIVVTLTYTLGRYRERIEAFQDRFGQRLQALLEERLPEDRLEAWRRMRGAFRQDPESRRKTPHLMMGVFIAFYAGLGYLALRGLDSALRDGSHELRHNLHAAVTADPGTALAAGHLFSVTCLLGLLYVILPTELLRLRFPELSYPFKTVILSRLRPREAGLFGAHYYIAATLPLAVLLLTRHEPQWPQTIPAVLAVVGVTVFADAASALVGIRYGRRKWPHNPNKSYAGSLGGIVVAFAVALPFAGPWGAALAAAVFLAVDVAAPVPFSVSDNILNPLALAAAFRLWPGTLDPLVPYY